MTLWVVRAGSLGEYENYYLEKGVIAITWNKLSDSLIGRSKEEFKKYLSTLYPECNKNSIANQAGQLFSFINMMKVGERVLLPSKIEPGTYHVGKITGDVQYMPDNPPYSHVRSVDWTGEKLYRKDIDADIRNSLGAFLTIFSIKSEMETRLFKNKPIKKKEEIVEEDESFNDMDLESDALDEITDRILQKFKGQGMQDVVASILRAKGYSTYVSKGADKGIDVLASNGNLGFGGSKICVQVKTEQKPIEHNVLRDLEGTMRNVGADYGLLVSWYGFKSSLDSEKRDKFFTIKFWDSSDIVREFLNNYDKLDDNIRQIVPLKKIWILEDSNKN